MPDWAAIKEATEAAKNAATVLALLIGGVWTYRTFVKQRLGFPRIETKLRHQALNLTGSKFVRVTVEIRNVGGVVLTSERAELRLRQIVPAPAELESQIAGGYDPVPSNTTGIEWPVLLQREWAWERGEFEVEPGETDLLCADFFVPRSAEVIEFYFFLSNSRKKKEIGWTCSTLVELNSGGTNNGIREEAELAACRVKGEAAAASTNPHAADS